MTLAELTTAVQEAVGDASTTQAELALNQKYREATVRAKWRKAEKSIGTTVADQGAYAFSAGDATDVQDLLAVRIDTTGTTNDYGQYSYVGVEEMWALKAGRLRLSGSGGVFAPMFESDADTGFELYPAPEASGDTIYGLCVLAPAALTSGQTPAIPIDCHVGIADGAIADLLGRLDEHLADANDYRQRYEQMVQRLSERARDRIGGQVLDVRVVGYSA